MNGASLSLQPTGAYSNLQELIRLRYGARDLKLNRQKKTFSLLVGPHQTKFRGRGVEFEEVRRYQAGDDIRSIDWRVTARSGKPHTKLFREERERPVLLLVDQSLPMFFGSRTCFKSVMAANCAALLAWAAFQQNDRVGGLVFSGSEHAEVRPKRSAKNVLQLLNSIHAFNNQLSRQSHDSEAGLSTALEELRRITRPGSNIFIISDFHHFNGDCEKHLYQLSRHNDISAVLVHDPLEENLPPSGYYSVTDGEQRAMIFTGDKNLRRQYRMGFRSKSGAIRHLLGPMGIPLLSISTQDAPLQYFRNLLGGRRK
jgi:uncharacterized protein (DUF58 family)